MLAHCFSTVRSRPVLCQTLLFKARISSACTAQSQRANDCESHSMEYESMLFVTNHLPYLWGILSSFFPVVSFIFTATVRSVWIYFIKWCQKEGSIKLRIYNSGWNETLKLVSKLFRAPSTNWKSSSMSYKASF